MKSRTQTVQTSLEGIAKKAAKQEKYRFQNLAVMLDEEMLLSNWRFIHKDAAYGVDRVSAREYEQDLEGNVRQLVERLKRGSYRAKLVKRRYIPKGDGRKRPLGIPATEDKLLQLSVKRILEAIYEADFLKCSYGYRPKVGARDAVHDLTVKLQFGPYRYVVEADIKRFFDHVDHEWMVRMLQERVDDRVFMRLIKKWLKAGVLEEDGRVIHPVTGTPQGGIVSPTAKRGQHLLALRTRSVVPQGGKEAVPGRSLPDPVCGRLCVCVRIPRRRRAVLPGAAGAVEEVWAGAVGGEDTGDPVRS